MTVDDSGQAPQLSDFSLRHDGQIWRLCWTDISGEVAEALELDIEPDESLSRGDCVGEVAPYLPSSDLRDRFIALTIEMGYPVSVAEVNEVLARLGTSS